MGNDVRGGVRGRLIGGQTTVAMAYSDGGVRGCLFGSLGTVTTSMVVTLTVFGRLVKATMGEVVRMVAVINADGG